MNFEKMKLNLKSYHITVPVIVILVLLISCLAYFLYSCHLGGTSGQRISSIMPNLDPPKKMFVFIANAVMDSKQLFMTKKMSPNFSSVFASKQEADTVEKEARAFFKSHYGLSDAYLNLAMSELKVNPVAGYTDQESGEIVRDGGFVVMALKGKTLYGKYGGAKGVTSNKMLMLPYGYYMFGNNRIRYKGIYPMVTFSTYDGNVSGIDCKIEDDATGQTGMAQGVFFTKKLANGKDHILIKNVLTLN